ncbi:GntR family transcriptional regulator [Nocardioides sp. OK12]|uniref:DNA-binding transcriptional regulator YhcF (GntR family) n=1 Tax=Nocardioides marinisabuli TaxID=419476 RepID=A0A7Y9JQ39_9ACTN|nr:MULTISPECIES: GntR family transcriptional regulator [Nocardioides]NYD56811.1 DNA-binding transcriptional regulator YhcF (GntR family) [Nocardioides marinisabuli]GHJ59560.1 GntR family transcriptional regulator [Nocardioides sp. OK12]
MNLAVDTSSSVPPYEQLRAQIAGMVASGTLAAGTRLATVRQMAADLGLAPNTVARAYRELEADGVIDTHGRRGTFVRSASTPGPDLRDLVADYVSSARARGLTCAEATRLVEEQWSG